MKLVMQETARKNQEAFVSGSYVHIVIEPPKGWAPLKLVELWKFRELLLFLTWRDIKVRYKQTALGAMWAILQPVLTMIMFSIIFGVLAELPQCGGSSSCSTSIASPAPERLIQPSSASLARSALSGAVNNSNVRGAVTFNAAG